MKKRYFWVVEARFTAALDRLAPDARFVLAVSGGVDSVAMAHLFKVSGRPFMIAHCNFQLRGDDALADEQFVQTLGRELGVQVFVRRFATEQYATEQGISIQMAARDLRYAWFKELAAEHQAKVAIAHHANDVVETMLFNLTKGTGLAGLHGIAETDDFIIRPLLWAKKAEILTYAESQGLNWREDVSNASEKYMRNLIRQQVVPQLARINPNLTEAGLRTAQRLADAESFLQYAIDRLSLVKEQQGHIFIDKHQLLDLPGRQTVLYYLLRDYGFNYEQVATMLASLASTGAIFLASGWQLNIDREALILSKQAPIELTAVINLVDRLLTLPDRKLVINIYDNDNYAIPTDASVASVDMARLKFPLQLRRWQQGDTFVPLGMTGSKKVSDFLIDAKVPVNLKREVLVLVSGDEIVWVVGYRLDNRYKISRETKKVWQIKEVK